MGSDIKGRDGTRLAQVVVMAGSLNVPRGRRGFYIDCPMHLAVLWGLARLL